MATSSCPASSTFTPTPWSVTSFPARTLIGTRSRAAVTHDAASLSVGVTTVFDSLSVGTYNASIARDRDNLVRLTEGLLTAKEAGMLKADHRIHWRCETTSDDMTARLPPLAEHPMTALFSMMDHTPGPAAVPQHRAAPGQLGVRRG